MASRVRVSLLSADRLLTASSPSKLPFRSSIAPPPPSLEGRVCNIPHFRATFCNIRLQIRCLGTPKPTPPPPPSSKGEGTSPHRGCSGPSGITIFLHKLLFSLNFLSFNTYMYIFLFISYIHIYIIFYIYICV